MISVQDQNGDGKITGGKSVKMPMLSRKILLKVLIQKLHGFTEDRMKTETITENIIFSMHQAGEREWLILQQMTL